MSRSIFTNVVCYLYVMFRPATSDAWDFANYNFAQSIGIMTFGKFFVEILKCYSCCVLILRVTGDISGAGTTYPSEASEFVENCVVCPSPINGLLLTLWLTLLSMPKYSVYQPR